MITNTPRPPTMRTDPNPGIRELDQRINDGIDVRLLWNSVTDRISVAVEDQRTGEFFELPRLLPFNDGPRSKMPAGHESHQTGRNHR